MAKKTALGRGLDALIPASAAGVEGLMEIGLDQVQANPRQARKVFAEGKITELAASIAEHGLVQPVVVRRKGRGYELISGERRWRAFRLLGRETIPAIVREMDDLEATAALLIENIQRENLSPIEEAAAFNRLIEEFGLTQEEVGKKVGKSRATICNALRLLNLPIEVQVLVVHGTLSAGHARALVGLEDKMEQSALARKVVEKGLSVRALEEEIKRLSADKEAQKRRRTSAQLRTVARELTATLGTAVRIKGDEEQGRVEIPYRSKKELERVLATLGWKKTE